MHKRLHQAIRNVNNDTWIKSTKGATLDEIVSKAIATATTIPEELPIRNEIGTSPDNIAQHDTTTPPPTAPTPVPPPTLEPTDTPTTAPTLKTTDPPTTEPTTLLTQPPAEPAVAPPQPQPPEAKAPPPPILPTTQTSNSAHSSPQQEPQRIGLMWPRGIANNHRAAPLLHSYSIHGCPVDCGRPWEKEEILAAIHRGAHISAKEPAARAYLLQQAIQAVEDGFAKLITLGEIIDQLPENLKISPVAMVPHKSRDYRVILDLSFCLRFGKGEIPSVNSATAIMSPQKSMAELGQVVRRMISTLANNYDPNKPFKFAKVDIKDGFWRMVVSSENAWNFCYTIPRDEDDNNILNTKIVVPTALQMGWKESPRTFARPQRQHETSSKA